MKLKTLILLSLLAFLTAESFTQSQLSSVINAGGHVGSQPFNIGEPFVSTIGTNPILTQGFLQNYLITTSLEPTQDHLEISIYPNPFISRITIDSKSNHILYEVRIYSQIGELVSTSTISSPKDYIDLSDLLSGSYYVVISSEEEILYTTTIIKQS